MRGPRSEDPWTAIDASSRASAPSLLCSTLGCITIGKAPPRPVLSNDPSAGPAACYSECTVLTGCESRCGYVKQP